MQAKLPSTAGQIEETKAAFARMEPSLGTWVARNGKNGERVTWKRGAWWHTTSTGAKPQKIDRDKAAELYHTILF